METQYWAKVKEFHGVQLLRDPETMQCRIMPIERQAEPKTKSVETPVTPEQMARAEASWLAHCMARDAGMRAAASTPEPQKPMTFEEKLENDWRYSPALRAEFGGNLASYLAYCKAAEDGRCRAYGKV